VRAGGAYLGSHLPPFWNEPRNRAQGEFNLRWAPSSAAWLDVSVDAWRQDRHENGNVFSGPGDITMGGRAWIWQAPVFTGVAFAVKQPNADDERQLGTDETDITLLATSGAWLGQTWIQVHGGAAFLGDPHRFSSQDVAPTVITSAVYEREIIVLHSFINGTMETTHNPSQWSMTIGGEGRCPRLLGAEATVGLSPAAPNWGGRVWAGWGWGCTPETLAQVPK